MNIFVTDIDPIQSAIVLDDKRLNKMIIESAQLLSTALNCYGIKAPYKSTHINHPCNIWVRESRSNYVWLLEHYKALSDEYTRRYDKFHKSSQYYSFFLNHRNIIPEKGLTPFKNCSLFKDDETILAYKKTMLVKWNKDKSPKWNRQKCENFRLKLSLV